MLHPSHWTLRTKLVASILALFLALSVLTGAATVWFTRNSLLSQVDDQLTTAEKTISEPHDNDQSSGYPGPMRHLAPGLGTGQLQVTVSRTSTTTTIENHVFSPGQTSTLTLAQVKKLVTSGVSPSTASTVDLGGQLGRYRVVSAVRPDGNVTIVGLPLSPIDETIVGLIKRIALLGIIGFLTVGAASFALVRSNLRPLRRVAATAERVSELPLGEGEVRTHERVPSIDTDPRTEVGTVGLALNNLLNHVDSALDARHESEMQVRQFVADASHELRTPLASIRGYAELSRREREPVPESVTHALGRIESEAGRMTTLVEDLLLLARLDAGRDLERKPVDLTQIVVETLSDLHAAGPDHVWRLELPDDVEDVPEVIGDEARLRQVVINLLANARRHTPPGTIVTAGLHREGANRVAITVTDNGPGIPAEFMPRLFERFTRGDAARTRTEGSTGLGLSIVDAVVAAHHGQVRVDSEPGLTRFTVMLPTAGTSAATAGGSSIA